MLHALKGNGFDCLLTLVYIKMEHRQPLHVCTNFCIIYAHTGAGSIRVGPVSRDDFYLKDSRKVLFRKIWLKRILLKDQCHEMIFTWRIPFQKSVVQVILVPKYRYTLKGSVSRDFLTDGSQNIFVHAIFIQLYTSRKILSPNKINNCFQHIRKNYKTKVN